MRYLLLIPAICLAAPAAAVGTKPKQATTAKDVKPGEGAVAVSVRSEIFLPDTLEVYFIRDGGPAGTSDVIRFTRRQSMLAVSNDTTDYAVKVLRLPPGRYRLVGHGVNCPVVPSPGQVCSVSVTLNGIGGGSGIPRPSRGYDGDTPAFIVEAGKLTMIGDLLLSNENRILVSPLPAAQAAGVQAKFAAFDRAPPPTVPAPFVLGRAVRPAGMLDNFGREYR